MKTIDQLEHDFATINEKEKPSKDEVNDLLREITELINDTTEWNNLDSESKKKANILQKGIKGLLQKNDEPAIQARIENRIQASKSSGADGESQAEKINISTEADEIPSSSTHERNARAEELMEQAERAFYSGRYQDAMKFYDQVLKLESDWERAKEHRAQADEYMTKGHIPETMLPAEAASLFGKAQSASRVMRLKDAMDMLTDARRILSDNGITRWNEGTKFEKELTTAMDAEGAAEEAKNLFSQGRINEAIDKVELAANLTGYPRYKAAAEEYKEFNQEIKSLHEILFSGIVSLSPVMDALKRLTLLSAQNPGNQALTPLHTRLNTLKPILAEKIKQEVREIKSRVESAESLDDGYAEIEKAQTMLDDAINNTIASDPSFLTLSRDISRLKSDIEKFKNDLSKANEAYRKNRGWPLEAWRISRDIRKYYPTDSEVVKLRSDIRPFERVLTAFKILGTLVILTFIGYLMNQGLNRYHTYTLALTPTVTSTATQLPSPTSTITPSPLPPTPTITPMIARTVRSLWLRNGCYETTTAIKRIPEGTIVQLLPNPSGERRFDNLNRECVLVEAREEGQTTIGWLLLEDLLP